MDVKNTENPQRSPGVGMLQVAAGVRTPSCRRLIFKEVKRGRRLIFKEVKRGRHDTG
jgi:hypothetical protein